jgi:hypothetical protein
MVQASCFAPLTILRSEFLKHRPKAPPVHCERFCISDDSDTVTSCATDDNIQTDKARDIDNSIPMDKVSGISSIQTDKLNGFINNGIQTAMVNRINNGIQTDKVDGINSSILQDIENGKSMEDGPASLDDIKNLFAANGAQLRKDVISEVQALVSGQLGG